MTMLGEYAPDDVGDWIIRLDRRLRDVEASISDPSQPVGALPVNFPESGINIGGMPINADVDEVAVFDVEVASFLTENVANFTWDVVASAVEYEVEVVRWDGATWVDPRYYRSAGGSVQAGGLLPQTHYGARITAINTLGIRSDPFPVPPDYLEFDTALDATIPDLLTNLVIGRGATSVVLAVDPSTDIDVANGHGLYQFEIDTVNTFDSVNKRSKKDSAYVTAFNDVLSEDNWYGRVRPIDEFGNEGPWLVAGPTAAGGVVENMIFGTITGAKITVGTLDGDRITANTVTAAKLTTSDLTAADITLNGGSLKAGSPPTTGLLINSQGLRLYQGGVQTITLDAVTGAATFRGNIAGGTITIGTRFSVDALGTVYARNADIGGRIEASSGEIGGWTIGSTKLSGSGTIEGGTVTGSTIISNNFQTKSSGARVRMGDALTAADEIQFIGSSGGIGSIRNGQTVSGFTTSLRISAGGIIDVLANTGGNTVMLTANGPAADAGIRLNGYVTCNSNVYVGSNITLEAGSGDIHCDELFVNGSSGQITIDNDGWLNTQMPSGSSSLDDVRQSSGTLYYVSSSRRWKYEIEDLSHDVDSSVLHQLRPTSWLSRLHDDDLGGVDEPDKRYWGFIAEEVAEAHPDLAYYDEDGLPRAVNNFYITTLLVAEVQRLRREVDALSA